MKALLIFCALCASGWGGAYAQDADALLAQSKQAAGGDAWNDVRSLSITSEGALGVSGIKEQRLDLLRGFYLMTYRLGSFEAPGITVYAEGHDGTIAWDQDPSGYPNAVTDAASLRSVISEAYLARYAYWLPERAPARRQYAGRKQEGGGNFDVIQISPEGGQAFELWIDGTSHLIDRLVRHGPKGAATTYFSDYGQAGGLKVPFTTRLTTSKPISDVTLKVRKVQVSAAEEKVDFGFPALPPPDYQLPAGQDRVTIPFQLAGNYILLPITINGQGPFTTTLDTGSSSFVMSPDRAKELKLTPQGAYAVGGFGAKSLSVAKARIESVKLGGATLLHTTSDVVDMGMIAPIDMIVGYEFLRRFVVKIDYDEHLLTLTRPDKFVYRGNGVVLPLHLRSGIPAVDGSVDGVPGLFILDTGSEKSLALFGPFTLARDLRRKYAAGSMTPTGVGLGGIVQGQSVHVGILALGAANVPKVEADLTADQSGGASDTDIAGDVGEPVLKQFNLTFDYTHGRVILERSKGYGRAEDGHVGLELEPQGKGWSVTAVMPGSAAARAGIRKGDRVLEIEGKTADRLFFLALYDVFHRPVGTEVRMLIESGKQTRLVPLTLAP